MKKWSQVTHVSLAASTTIMFAFAVGGYATFTSLTEGDLLNNYCWHDDLMNVSRLFFSLTILLTYPIECFVCREVIENILGNFFVQLRDKETVAVSFRLI